MIGRSASGSQICNLRDKEQVTRMVLCQQIVHAQTNKITDNNHNTNNTKGRRTKNKPTVSKTNKSNNKPSDAKQASNKKRVSRKSSKNPKNEQIPLFKAPE